MARHPVGGPVLGTQTRIAITDSRQIVQPGKSLNLLGKLDTGRCDVPDAMLRRLDQKTGEQKIARDQLTATGKGANRARFGLRHEPRRGSGQRAQAGLNAVHNPPAPRGAVSLI